MGIATHTPGPWKLYYDGDIGSADGSTVVSLPFDSYREFNESAEVVKANYRLIAAAPDLLALAREMEAFSEAAMNDAIEADAANMGCPSEHKLDIITWTERRNNCRAAIAKATGAAA